ncbi:sigma-70 family RNA polymerase sigma factor [Chitinophaga japonensis]|uniref:RNA polymerase sigma-70 factor (ECF subfamily) n=1 Tax=Chitinophaga japonensis TaxID=104662 RepID=A0A562TGB1_CHIJA|nr:sigma-70 family RNA polymerase sigma factor [Chitinophaga japonensis]TWI92086.1 RNA polymerase sigma-70 factor (ECF subfamily) [Chitinophaga japonensis]
MKDYHQALFPYAYNILGSAEDAKDAIQDVLSNYVAKPREEVENERNYLIRSVINHAINLRNRRKKVNLGEVWLPEPVATEAADTDINLKDIVSYSMLVLLEQLNPKERAVFILKEGFGYSHQEIAEVLSGTEELSRKLLSRAKNKLGAAREEVKVRRRERVPTETLEKYVNMIRGRDTSRLENMLAEDITFYADGGGKVNVVRKICTGAQEVADLLVYVFEKYEQSATIIATEVNYQPALLFFVKGRLLSCQVLGIEAASGRIFQINTVVDPAKLKNIAEQAKGKGTRL